MRRTLGWKLRVLLVGMLLLGTTVAGQTAIPRVAHADSLMAGDACASLNDELGIDADPSTDGCQIEIPYTAEPEFLLAAGADHWDVRNRPLGTVGYAYGHESDTPDSAMQTTGRLPTFRESPTSWTQWAGGHQLTAATAAVRIPRDVATLAADDDRSGTWVLTAYEDGSVDVDGSVEGGYPVHVTWSAREPGGPLTGGPASGGFVGGTVISDDGHGAAVALVGQDDHLYLTSTDDPDDLSDKGAMSGTSGSVHALAAVSRSYTTYAKSPRWDGLDNKPDAGSTMMLVLLSNGELPLYAVGHLDDRPTFGVTLVISKLSTWSSELHATGPLTSGTRLDFDYECLKVQRQTIPGMVSAAGDWSGHLSCPSPGSQDNTATFTLGRLSVAVGNAGTVRALFGGDFVYEAPDGGPAVGGYPLLLGAEHGNEPACDSLASAIPAGSFDLRLVSGTTHVACVKPEGPNDPSVVTQHWAFPSTETIIGTRVSEPNWPTNVQRASKRTGGRSAAFATSELDGTFDPAPGVPVTRPPMITTTFDHLSSPVIQLQFPCAELLTRPTGARKDNEESYLEDCDASTDGRPNVSPPAGTEAAVPTNWTTYTIAAYGTAHDTSERALLVHSEGASRRGDVNNRVPADLTILAPTNPSPWGDYPSERNFASTLRVSPYFAADLDRNRAGIGDPAQYDKYAVPMTETPLFLAQVVRPADLTEEITVEQMTLRTTPSAPLAIMLPIPVVDGLGQDGGNLWDYLTIAQGSGQENFSGTSVRAGGHFGVEATALFGVGLFGTSFKVGVNVSLETQVQWDAEQSFARSVDYNVGETYYGRVTDTTVITQSFDEHVYPATVVTDPTGLQTGSATEFSVPQPGAGSRHLESHALGDLAQQYPGLYEAGGLYRNALDRILCHRIPPGEQLGCVAAGDPGSYPQFSEADKLPTSILASGGGGCIGDYDKATDLSLPKIPVYSANPYYASPPTYPTGRGVVMGGEHTVTVGSSEAPAQGTDIDISSSGVSTASRTFSLDLSLTGSLIAESQASVGTAAELRLGVTAGADAGGAATKGVTNTLTDGTTFSTVLSDIPHGASDVGSWIDDETYSWKSYFCKAKLGASVLGQSVWVFGFVTSGYSPSATHGITELSDVAGISPVNGAIVPANPEGQTSARTPGGKPIAVECGTDATTPQQEFHWGMPAGTVKDYTLQVRDTNTGVATDYATPASMHWDTPQASKATVRQSAADDRVGLAERPSCVAVASADFNEGHRYEWRLVAEGFLKNRAKYTDPVSHGAETWSTFVPQVSPAGQAITLRTPLVNSDGSLQIDIVDPAGVSSFRHDVTVTDATDAVVSTTLNGGTSVRTAAVKAGGNYVVHVKAHNAVRDDAGAIIYSPEATATIHVPPKPQTLTHTQSASQVTYGGSVTFSTVLTDTPGGKKLGSVSVTLQRQSGASWVSVRSVTTNSSGVASFALAPSVPTTYRWSVPARSTSAADYTAATSAPFTVKVAVKAATPTIAGTKKVGSTLRVNPGTWGPAPVSLAYKWYRCSNSCTAIAAAKGKTYKLVGSDAARTIKVAVTGSKTGYTTVTKTSAATAKVAKGTLSPAPAPTIAGTKRVGSTLRVNPGTWGPAPVSLAYKWYRCSRSCTAIAAAKGKTYKLVGSDAGRTIKVTVTGSKTGYTTLAKTSRATGAVAR